MKRRWSLIASLIVVNLIIWLAVAIETPGQYLTVAFLDVGQGDAILITAPNRNQVLIDGGPSRQTVRALAAATPFYDRSLDLVVATHPDADHIGGLPEVLSRYHVAGFLESPFRGKTTVYESLEIALAEAKTERLVAKVGTKIILGPETVMEVLAARTPTLGPRGGQPAANDSSLVIKLTHGENTFLLTGDLSAKLLDQLAARSPEAVRAEVLKVSHHGSKNSSSLWFFRQVDPNLAIISAGANNRFGHPHQEVLTWLRVAGIQTFNTADAGTITLKSDGATVGF
ncbi:MAG: hypothetical protein COV08_00550 [Candidatus Vogelbacteria bacterium CG10_big_fil_rev_8_21_14_0_10_49_38]|uniref:Metallo-beta-lactamase domain-containing protein n=1 Tax=Candidatus Vogelbacteria bacterium CG10_big_fil_rev_8_21_14_0_10_49_38 TaxID=1975043 RepID=A0A2H0RIU1_9BACT|nr:MAG: hypothetical protein BK006_00555 [bacterium CG10_49_38]PIR46408.1 MAG: hypothetical protein COV08_00550 [Candidatus Vogelbacteria bacterium CG10_big_fil_rev_8_21_14_0_10_49_38]